jgi:hypothetical protein
VIVPIVVSKSGEDKTVGTASVTSGGEVNFYLQPGFTLADEVAAELTKQLQKLARKQSGTDGLSIA